MRFAILSFCLGPILGAATPLFASTLESSAPARRDTLALDVTLAGTSYATPAVKSLLLGPTLDLRYAHVFNAYAEARVAAGAEVLTGATSGVMPNELLSQLGPRQIIRLREAVIDLHTGERAWAARLGALNQRAWENPLLGGDIVFLGAETEGRATTPAGDLSLTLLGAVPPTSFSQLETAVAGRTPGVVGARVADQLGKLDEDFVRVTAGYYQFDNLTTAQARQSLFWGNTITGNARSAQFYLPYRGVEGGLRAGLRFASRWQANAQVNALQNTAAPAGSGLGYLTSLGATHFGDEAKVSGSLGYVYDQSDSSPAVFADGFLASKNHRGLVVQLAYDTASYSIFARALKTHALIPQLYGGDNTAVLIGVQVHYDLL